MHRQPDTDKTLTKNAYLPLRSVVYMALSALETSLPMQRSLHLIPGTKACTGVHKLQCSDDGFDEFE